MRYLASLFAALVACAASPTQAAGFTSPSGNIACYLDVFSPAPMDQTSLICLVFEADWVLPPDYGDGDPTCDLDRTRTVILPRNGQAQVRWTCHGDVFWPAPLGEISYGSEWSLMGFSCDMATDGVRCVNGQGNSLHVRRTSYALD